MKICGLPLVGREEGISVIIQYQYMGEGICSAQHCIFHSELDLQPHGVLSCLHLIFLVGVSGSGVRSFICLHHASSELPPYYPIGSMVQLHSAALLLLLHFENLRSEILNSKLQPFFRSESMHRQTASRPGRLSAGHRP